MILTRKTMAYMGMKSDREYHDFIRALKRNEPLWDEASGQWIYEKRGRGRPRTRPPEYGPKRPRGRPPKLYWEDKVTSTNLKKIYYDKTRQVMTVEFNSGPTYEYSKVPQKMYNYLKRAKSKGKYFHKKIRFSYPYKRIKG